MDKFLQLHNIRGISTLATKKFHLVIYGPLISLTGLGFWFRTIIQARVTVLIIYFV